MSNKCKHEFTHTKKESGSSTGWKNSEYIVIYCKKCGNIMRFPIRSP